LTPLSYLGEPLTYLYGLNNSIKELLLVNDMRVAIGLDALGSIWSCEMIPRKFFGCTSRLNVGPLI
jgi:hypothetical protein